MRATVGAGFGSRIAAETGADGLEETTMDARIETIGPIQVARIRRVGPCAEVGRCFERLFRRASAFGAPTGRIMTLSREDPEAVPPEGVRCDACVKVHTGEAPPPGTGLCCAGGGPAGRPAQPRES